MKALYDAIFVKYGASTLPDLLIALHNTKAVNLEPGKEVEFPYAVVQVVNGNVIDFATGEHFTTDWFVQFNLFEKGPNMNVILEAFSRLTATFDSCTLVVDGTTFLSCRRAPGIRQTEDKGVWQINLAYNIRVRSI